MHARMCRHARCAIVRNSRLHAAMATTWLAGYKRVHTRARTHARTHISVGNRFCRAIPARDRHRKCDLGAARTTTGPPAPPTYKKYQPVAAGRIARSRVSESIHLHCPTRHDRNGQPPFEPIVFEPLRGETRFSDRRVPIAMRVGLARHKMRDARHRSEMR